MNKELLEDVLRTSIDVLEYSTNSKISKWERTAQIIELAVDLKMDGEFKEELISDLESECIGLWWKWLPEDNRDEDFGSPDAMEVSKANKLDKE